MATWLDVLGSDYFNSQGVFNPFALVRGFTKSGRQDIDQQRALQQAITQNRIIQEQEAALSAPVLSGLQRSLARQQQGSIGRMDQAIQGIGQQGSAFQPRSPEAADVIEKLLGIDSARQDLLQRGSQEQRTAQEFEAKRPFMTEQQILQTDLMRQQRDVGQETLRNARQVDNRVGLLLDALEQSGNLDPKVAEALIRSVAGGAGNVGQHFLDNINGPAQQIDPTKLDMQTVLRAAIESRARPRTPIASQSSVSQSPITTSQQSTNQLPSHPLKQRRQTPRQFPSELMSLLSESVERVAPPSPPLTLDSEQDALQRILQLLR